MATVASDIIDLHELEEVFESVADYIESDTPLDIATGIGLKQVTYYSELQIAPDGSPYPALTDEYADQKQKEYGSKKADYRASGEFIKSIKAEKGLIQTTGTRRSKIGLRTVRSGRKVTHIMGRRVVSNETIAKGLGHKRPLFDVSDDSIDKIENEITSDLEQKLGG